MAHNSVNLDKDFIKKPRIYIRGLYQSWSIWKKTIAADSISKVIFSIFNSRLIHEQGFKTCSSLVYKSLIIMHYALANIRHPELGSYVNMLALCSSCKFWFISSRWSLLKFNTYKYFACYFNNMYPCKSGSPTKLKFHSQFSIIVWGKNK